MIAFDVRHYDSIGSTNDEALRLARDGAPHGTVVCAREQTAGRGRHARRWHSPIGNLYVSLLLRPDVAPGRAAELSFVAALAVADAVEGMLPDGIRVELKWPNDVLVGGAKIAGILLEYADGTVIVGIGLNIQHAPSFATYAVTSLVACGAEVVPAAIALDFLLEAFARRLTEWEECGFDVTRRAWLARAHAPGSLLRVTIGDRIVTGRFVNMASDGALIVATADGTARIVAGDVT